MHSNNEIERYKAARPQLIEHRLAIEIEMRKAARTAWPPPHIVMDRLLNLGIPFAGSEFAATDAMIQDFDTQKKIMPQKKLSFRLNTTNSQSFRTPKHLPAISTPVVETQKKQKGKEFNLQDWKQTPIYLNEMGGESQVEAIVM